MNFEDDEQVYINQKGKVLIEKAKRAISIEKSFSNRNIEIESAMNELYEYFSSYPEEELTKFGLQLEIFKVERMLKDEFLPLDSEPIFNPNSEMQFPDKITSQQECESALDFIVHSTRKKLSESFDLETATLEKHCLNTSWKVEDICKDSNIDFLHLGLDRDLKQGMFHHFTLARFPLENGETKNYLIDCTYRQFFTKSDSFKKRISVMRGPAKGCSIGAYMMMTEKRKQIAEELLTKGYIEATQENIKEYFDAMVFSGRDIHYYKSQCLDFTNPNDCIPEYSMTDYMKMLTQNHVIDENSNFKDIFFSSKNITPADAARSALKETTTDKANEAKDVEQSELNPENIKEGETKDDK